MTPAPMALPQAAETILARLRDAGYSAYIVGGSVRDSLRGVSPHDYDMTTDATPEEMHEVFRDYHLIDTGIRHGTVAVMVNREQYEITTFRVDGDYLDCRHPDSVSFTRSLREDLARRDFTMNAIAYSPEDGYQDPFGGIADIEKGIIRAVGDPETRFREDALRILRALRFSATLGFRIEEETARAASRTRELIKNVSRERIRDELMKLLAGDTCVAILRQFPDILATVIPALAPLYDCPQNSLYHLYPVWEHTLRVVEGLTNRPPLLRLVGLLHDVGKPACRTTDAKGKDHFKGHPEVSSEIVEGVMRDLKFDNKSRETAVLLTRIHDLRIPPREADVLRLLSEIGYENFLLWNDLQRADNDAHDPSNPVIIRGKQNIAAIRRMGEDLQSRGACYRLTDLALTGKDILAETGLSGKAVGEALGLLLGAVMDGRIPNTREALLPYLRTEILPTLS